MAPRDPVPPHGVNIGAALVLAAFLVVAIGVIAAIDWPEGPVAPCEARGGYYMVGPAGETSCIDRNTFLPMPDPDSR